jgi:hypothetical protein
MAKKEMKVTRRRSHGRRKKKDLTTRTNIQDMMKRRAATRNPNMTKENPTRNIMKLERRRRKESTDTRSSTRRDRRPLVTTRRPTRMNTTRNTNSTMTSTKKANIR